MERPPLCERVRLEYALPSECADRVQSGEADIGIVPVIEIERQGLEYFSQVGIACDGRVRSILLISARPPGRVRTLAADAGSRSSVMLSRVILAEAFGADPEVVSMPADLDSMLARADAALIIGDAALRLDPDSLRQRYEVLDLGEEWLRLTGLPMVFALWAGQRGRVDAELGAVLEESCRMGRQHIDDIIEGECLKRGIGKALGREYLTRHIVFELGERHREGMRTYLNMSANLRMERRVSA